MPFFDFIGAASSIAGLYDFIKDKLKNDRNEFIRQVRKSTCIACDEFADTLTASYEFRTFAGRISPDDVCDSVVKMLDKDRPLTVNDILPYSDIPLNIRTALLENVLKKLRGSLQYAQYHYGTWIVMSQNEIIELLGGISGQLNTIINIIDNFKIPRTDKIKTIKTPSIKTRWVGRDNEIKEIFLLLNKCNSVIILNGLGGIGKTETTKKYFFTQKDLYDEIFWYEFDTSLKKTLVQQTLIWPDDPYTQYNPIDYYNRILNYLVNRDARTIVFVDNVENASDVDLVDLTRLSCHVLVNSRNVINGYEQYPINLLSETDSISLFKLYCPRKRYSKKESNYISAINKLAGYHTLTIELIAKTISSSRMSFSKMFMLLYDKGFNLNNIISKTISVNWHDDINNRKIFDHLKIVFDISGLSVQESTILFYFSLLPSENLMESQFTNLFQGKYDSTIESLARKGWITIDKGKIIIHNIVQETVRSFHKLEYEQCKPLIDAIANASEDLSDISNKKFFVDWVISILKYILVSDESYVIAINNAAWISKLTYSLDMALQLSEVCIEAIDSVECKKATIISVYNIYSLLLLEKEDSQSLKLALHWQEKCLDLRKEVKKDEYKSKHNIAIILSRMGRFEDAWKEEIQVLEYKKANNENEKSIAITYSTLATIQRNLGNIEAAIEYQKLALQIREKYPDELNPLFISYKLLGNLYDIVQYDTEAIRMYDLALQKLYRISKKPVYEKFKCHVHYYHVLKRSNRSENRIQKDKAIKVLYDLYIGDKDTIDIEKEFQKVRLALMKGLE